MLRIPGVRKPGLGSTSSVIQIPRADAFLSIFILSIGGPERERKTGRSEYLFSSRGKANIPFLTTSETITLVVLNLWDSTPLENRYVAIHDRSTVRIMK